MRNDKEFRNTADVVVVGGGVAGLVVARELARRGTSTVVIERGRFGREASFAAAGLLAPQAEADHADAFFELASTSRNLYPQFAEHLREETNIDIELDQTGTLYLAFTETDAEEIAERHHWQTEARLAVERLTSTAARELEPHLSPLVRAALLFPLDWQVENRRLITALVAAAEKYEVGLIESTEAATLLLDGDRVAGVATSRGDISSRAVIVAGGAWSSLLETVEHRAAAVQVEPVRGQMLCFDACPPLVRHVVYSPRAYLVPRRDGRLLAGSTTERVGFDKSVTAGGVHRIATHALEIAPGVAGLTLTNTWAGLRPRTADGWPVLGASAEVQGLYYATGHYRNGILLAPITGQLIVDLITSGVASPLLKAFGPERFHPLSVAHRRSSSAEISV